MGMKKKTFQEWMNEVDVALVNKCGMGHEDLPDVSYRDMYDSGKSAKSAAAKAYKAAKDEF